MTRGVNPVCIEALEIRDTSDHFSTVMDIRTVGKALCKLTNTHDQAVTVTLQGATFEDPAITDPVDLDTGQAVAAGTTKHISTSEPFSFLRVKAAAAVAPASGALTLTWEFKHGRD